MLQKSHALAQERHIDSYPLLFSQNNLFLQITLLNPLKHADVRKKKTMTLKYRHVRVMSRPCQSPDNGRVVEDHQIRLIAFDIRLASFWAPGDVEGHRLTSEHSMLI